VHYVGRIVTERDARYGTVDLDRGAGHGNMKPAVAVQPVEIQSISIGKGFAECCQPHASDNA
jgi:hypothetical protein